MKLILLLALLLPASAQTPFDGRWDFIVTPTGANAAPYPDWMELSNGAIRIQPRSGSAFVVKEFKIAGSHLTAQWPTNNTVWELDAAGGKLTGVQKRADAVTAKLAGWRAPALDRKMPATWTRPARLFNGKDLTGWEPMGTAKSNWVVENGDLLNKDHGANLRTTQRFDDFKLHIEFNCPDEGNSGIYLRGRYEVQIEYEKVDANDKFHSIGSIYSFIAPAVDLPRTPGKWEAFDITLVGRRLTVVRNGTKTIDNQEIPGPTGGALDSDEAEPGPFYIQGDHTGGLRFRNITVQVPAGTDLPVRDGAKR